MTHEIRWYWQPTGKNQTIEQWQRVTEPKWVHVDADVMPKQKVNNGWIDAWAKSLSFALRDKLPANCRIDVVSSRTLGDVFGYLRIRVALPGRWYRIAELRPINQANPNAVVETSVPVIEAPVIAKVPVQERVAKNVLYLVSINWRFRSAFRDDRNDEHLHIKTKQYLVWSTDSHSAKEMAGKCLVNEEQGEIRHGGIPTVLSVTATVAIGTP